MSQVSPTASAGSSQFAQEMQQIQQQTEQDEVLMAKNQEQMQQLNDQINLQNTAKQGEESASKGS